MLTRRDVASGPQWMIVATRDDGTRYVLGSASTEDAAGRPAELYRKHLEGLTRVDVERVACYSDHPEGGLHGDD
jgi:hypothetical protein